MAHLKLIIVALLVMGGITVAVLTLRPGRRALVSALDKPYEAVDGGSSGAPWYDGPDSERPRISIRLTPVVRDAESPVDLQFLGEWLYVVEKEGGLRRADIKTGTSTVVARWDVLSESEQGLLGLAFHPKFADNHRFFVNFVADVGGRHVTRVESWVASDDSLSSIKKERTIIEVEQPYQNHNAGQLAFGPDGYLYIGFGDGGWRDDPHGHGQDSSTFLGSMLRLDIDGRSGKRGYRIPADNPKFAGAKAQEIYAIGLRNPWRYSFAPDGRLVVADVGQDFWEELSFIPKGSNLGWNVKEAEHCFAPEDDCLVARADELADRQAPLQDPFHSYGRDEGKSITGGFVVTDTTDALVGHYVFADFVSGRIWALKLPKTGERAGEIKTLGRWPLLLSSFGRDGQGKVYVADIGGTVFRLDAVN